MVALGASVDARTDAPAETVAVPSEPREVRTEPGWARRNWELLAIVGATIAVTLLAKHLIYPAFSWNRDEATYLWQIESLRTGHIFTSDGNAPQFFWPWLSGIREGGFFSQYTVGWPVVLLWFDSVFGSPELALAFGGVLAVLGTYAFAREVTDNRQLALLSATLMVASPLLVIQGGVYLPYLFSLGLGLFFGTMLLRGIRLRSHGMLLAGGGLLGWLLLTRPFDAVLWAAPMFLYALILYWRRWRVLWDAALWTGIALFPFVVFTLIYNHRVTGSFTEFPITAKEPLDSFGFGLRRLMPFGDIFDYNLDRAVRSTLHNFRVVPPFLVGGWVGAVAAVFGVWLRRRERSTIALLGVAVSIPIGYFFFWGNLLSSRAAGLSAPIYFVPLYAPACIFVAATLIWAWRRRHAFGVALAVILAAATVPPLVDKIDVNHKISLAQVPWKGATDPIHGKALVFIENSGPYLMHLDPYSGNTPMIDGRIIYSVDRGHENMRLIASHPRRAPYLLRTSDPGFDDPVGYHDAPVPTVTLIPLRVLSGRTVTLRMRATATRHGGPVVEAFLQMNDHVERRVLSIDAKPGETFETEWTIASGSSSDATRAGVEPFDKGTGTIGAGFSTRKKLFGKKSETQFQQFAYDIDPSNNLVKVLYPSRTLTSRGTNGPPNIREVDDVKGLDVELTLEH
jgi:hypothetical protein